VLPELDKLNAVVLGVSPDSEKSHAKFIQKHELTVELLSDTAHEALEAFGVWQKKKMYGKEYMGVVRSTFLIDTKGAIAEIWPKVKVKGHAEAVVAVLKELQ
jgi:thioredoxin-dependent peroxiredoxin